MTEATDVVIREKVPSPDYNGNVEKKEYSKWRQAAPQVCAVMAKNLLLLTFGSTLGFPTILLPALQKNDPDIPVTMEDLTWISSINLFAVPLGCVVSGPLSQYLGRRKTMLISNIPFVASWVILHYSTNAPMLFIALSLTGLTGGLTEAPVLTYVAEVTQPHLRGMLSATSTMSVILGIFTQLLTGSLTDWRTACLINLIYPVVCFLTLAIVPESPYWLAGKNRMEDAEKSLRWLRGWVPPSNVREELQLVLRTIHHPPNEEEHQNESYWAPFFRRTFTIPLMLVSLIFFLAAFGGSATLQTFAVSIFDKVEVPMNKYTATLILGVAELLGTATCVASIHFVGKRRLNWVSISGTGLCFFGSAIYIYLLEFKQIERGAYSWIPTAFLIGSAFISHMGIRQLAWILAGEVFPAKIRSSATGIAAAISYIFMSVINKIFLYMVNAMGLSGTFLFYAGMNLAGGIALYLSLPETEGRTLKEIEEHFAGIQSLKHRPKNDGLADKEKWATANPAMVLDDVESKL
ncbi:facilitated trehalose transporter Tret1 isoform X2 [Diachasma alloeum]|uniref:facilitated trehalose transporter Tret1 isoform X2 n=1 Tax=Diachasma alloeum TaxID=454923 RepID=UPI0007382B4E|nr:facilitated trehalose transporter Tret1 isoform X2 [Diachasma alloeum]